MGRVSFIFEHSKSGTNSSDLTIS